MRASLLFGKAARIGPRLGPPIHKDVRRTLDQSRPQAPSGTA